MSEDRDRILGMLAEGKADEAARLLDALAARGEAARASGPATRGDASAPVVAALPKYLFVKVTSENGDNIDVKVPVALIRSGLKLTSLIPPQALDQINSEMSQHGISIDFANLKGQDIDDLVAALREMEVKVDSKDGDKVRVYCE
jgi:hypothetical protein